MSIKHRPDSLADTRRQRRHEEMVLRVASIPFVLAAQKGEIDDVTIAENADVFVLWDENFRGKAGTIVRDELANGTFGLYKSIHDVTNAGQNTKPSATPSMWTTVSDPSIEFPPWVQPIGAHDAYNVGDKCAYNKKNWISTVPNNSYPPGLVAGQWEEVK